MQRDTYLSNTLALAVSYLVPEAVESLGLEISSKLSSIY